MLFHEKTEEEEEEELSAIQLSEKKLHNNKLLCAVDFLVEFIFVSE